jgi:hypothetical protein
MKARHVAVLLAPVLLLVVVGTAGADLERDLEARLKGAWAVTAVEVFSGCGGAYTNNSVTGGGVSSRADRRFEPGELVKVDKLSVKRSEVHFFLSLAEPVLVGRVDGPFELFDERSCRVQLMLELGRPTIAAGDAAAVFARLEEVLEVFPSLEAARGAERWNGRRREPYPDDYQETLARYAVWQAEQVNVAVAARSDQALGDAIRGVDRVRSEPAYLDGFAAGVEAARSWSERSCDTLVSVTFGGAERQPPREKGGDRAWCQGYRDGQELTFNLLLADRLRGCFVPVPPLPPGVVP